MYNNNLIYWEDNWRTSDSTTVAFILYYSNTPNKNYIRAN